MSIDAVGPVSTGSQLSFGFGPIHLDMSLIEFFAAWAAAEKQLDEALIPLRDFAAQLYVQAKIALPREKGSLTEAATEAECEIEALHDSARERFESELRGLLGEMDFRDGALCDRSIESFGSDATLRDLIFANPDCAR